MRSQSYWNTKRVFLLVIALSFLLSLVVTGLPQQRHLNTTRQMINERQEIANQINDQIVVVKKATARTQDITQRQKLILERIDLEAQRLDAEIQRLNLENTQDTLSIGQSGRFILSLLGVFFVLYIVFISND